MQGIVDPEFISLINGTMICLTCAILCHTLMAWQTGIYQDPPDFQGDRGGDLLVQQEEMWRNFDEDVQTGVIEDISRAIMAMVQQNQNIEKVQKEGYQDDMGKETDDSLDLSQSLRDPELRFLGSSPPHVEDLHGISFLLMGENIRSPIPSGRLSHSLDDSQDAQGLVNPTGDQLPDGMDEGEAAPSENLPQDSASLSWVKRAVFGIECGRLSLWTVEFEMYYKA
ncbi:hypothetical protein HOY80DRAFT_1030462 [Tuber brumale]|nr:hypothetical protein HOY80DRAFT_1030462 [Tuber brumale]